MLHGMRGFQVLRAPEGAAAGGATGGAIDPATASTGAAVGGATAGAAAAAGAGNVAQPTAPVAWTDSIQDADLREWAVNKGYNKQDPTAAAPIIAQQYRSLEKLVGAEKAGRTLEIPDFNDQKAADAFYDRIGRPKDVNDYKIALPDEKSGVPVNKEFETWARQNFHKIGLNAKQAEALSGAWNEMAIQANIAEAAAQKLRFEGEDKALKTKWGATYDDKISKASAAAKGLGIPGELIDALQKVGGYGLAMETFANLAEKVGEDKFVSGEGGNVDGKMTPAEAKTALNAFKADKEQMAAWMDKAHPKHKDAVARVAFLSEMMVAGQ